MKPLNILTIRIDGGTQSRVEINTDTVSEYASALTDGAKFPPVVVFFDGADYWLADGFHRFHAYRKVGCVSIETDVHQGTARDAKLYSFGANSTHGQRRTNADKRKAVAAMLADDEWVKWSDSQIAKTCGVSHHLVADVRETVTWNSPSDNSVERTFTSRHGKTATMDTSKIGKKGDSKIASPSQQEVAQQHLAPAIVAAQSEIGQFEEDFSPDAEEMAKLRAHEEAEIKTLQLMLASDDVAAALAAKNTQLEAQVKMLDLRIAGLQNANTEHVRTIKSLRKQIDKLKNPGAV